MGLGSYDSIVGSGAPEASGWAWLFEPRLASDRQILSKWSHWFKFGLNCFCGVCVKVAFLEFVGVKRWCRSIYNRPWGHFILSVSFFCLSKNGEQSPRLHDVKHRAFPARTNGKIYYCSKPYTLFNACVTAQAEQFACIRHAKSTLGRTGLLTIWVYSS